MNTTHIIDMNNMDLRQRSDLALARLGSQEPLDETIVPSSCLVRNDSTSCVSPQSARHNVESSTASSSQIGVDDGKARHNLSVGRDGFDSRSPTLSQHGDLDSDILKLLEHRNSPGSPLTGSSLPVSALQMCFYPGFN